MALFRWNSIMHNTRPHKFESKIYSWFFFSWKLFNYSKNMRCVKITHIALQFREGRDEGIQTKCFDFFLEVLGVKNFFRFFWARRSKKNYCFFFVNLLIFLKFYLQLSAVISLGRFRFQALPDLWSPRVWFTFRNKKVRRIK